MNGAIEISKDEYISLLMAKEKLDRLEIGGVDNWEWYGESISQEEDLEDMEIRLERELS